MNPKLIVINDKTHNGVDEMPEDVRKQYESAMDTLKDDDENHLPDIVENMNILAGKDRDGMPDVFENISSNAVAAGSTKIIVDGKEYNSLADLPPDVHIRYEKALGKLDANQNGMPDSLEGMVNTLQTTNVETRFGSGTARRSRPLPVSPAVTPDTSNGRMLAIAVIGWMAFMG